MRTIVLADDSPVTLAVEKSYLESRSFKVFSTSSATEALELSVTLRPDLILLDYDMPVMNGDLVCRALKERPETAGIPVIILTAHQDPAIRKKCEEAGAVEFVQKSTGRETLLDKIAAVLGLPRRRHVRVPCRLEVTLLAGEARIRAVAHNVSAGGLYITLDRELQQGAALQLSLSLPDVAAPVQALGEVVRTEHLGGKLRGYGIQLIQAEPEAIEALKSFVAKTL